MRLFTTDRLYKTPLIAFGLLLAMVWGLQSLTTSQATVLPVDMPQGGFSGERAFDILSDLLQENQPHPVGSAVNQVIRDRIIQRLHGLGLDPEIQRGFGCVPKWGRCSAVENIITTVRSTGTNPDRKAILLIAHYDSGAASVGASDDISGVSVILEILNNLQAHEPLGNDVIILITDGEEMGLIGAQLFADEHPLIDRVGLVLNMEARGNSGPSVMFETGDKNLAVFEGYKAATARPVGNSLAVEMYKRMPNDTDYSVYKVKGIPGLNYAFVQGVSVYHSRRDDPSHVDKATLQHQGENVLASLLYFGDSDLGELDSDEDATWFDLFGRMLISWSASMGVIMGLYCLLGSLVLAVKACGIQLKMLAKANGVIFFGLILLATTGWILSWPLGQFGTLHPIDHPYPWPGRGALIGAAVLGTILMARLAARIDLAVLWAVVWIFFSAIGTLLAFTISGASYLALAPAFVAVTSALVLYFTHQEKALVWSNYAGLAVGAYIGIYHMLMLSVVGNFQVSYVLIIPLLFLALPLLVAAAWWRSQGYMLFEKGLAAAVVILTITAMVVPGFTEDRPRGVNIIYQMDEITGIATWEISSYGPADKDYLFAAGFPEAKVDHTLQGVHTSKRFIVTADNLDLKAPLVMISMDRKIRDGRAIRGTIASRRSGVTLGIGTLDQSKLISLTINGKTALDAGSEERSGPHSIIIAGMGSTPVPFELHLKHGDTDALRFFDAATLESEGRAKVLQDLRPETAAPVFDGDLSIIVTGYPNSTLAK